MAKKHGFLWKHKKLVILASILLVLAAATAGRLLYERAVIDHVRSIADKLIVTPNMVNRRESINPPYLLCIGDSTCPELVRTWDLKSPLSSDEFATVLQSYNNPKIDRPCSTDNIGSGAAYICGAEFQVDSYIVSVHMQAVNYPSSSDTKLYLRILDYGR